MNTRQMRNLVRELAPVIDAEKVIIYGSYSKRTSNYHTDVTLFFIAESDLPRIKRNRMLYQQIDSHKLALELVVYTPKEAQEALKSKGSFASSILRNGKVIYRKKMIDLKNLKNLLFSKLSFHKFTPWFCFGKSCS